MLEEWRMGRSWAGRVQQAHWQLLLQGSKVGARARAPARAPQQAKPARRVWDRPCSRVVASPPAQRWRAGSGSGVGARSACLQSSAHA